MMRLMTQPLTHIDISQQARMMAEQKRIRDPRHPSPGTILSRQYHGREIRVVVLDDGFEHDGQHYGSLSALARAVTGARWNGRLFFGLTKRTRRS